MLLKVHTGLYLGRYTLDFHFEFLAHRESLEKDSMVGEKAKLLFSDLQPWEQALFLTLLIHSQTQTKFTQGCLL